MAISPGKAEAVARPADAPKPFASAVRKTTERSDITSN